jgi:hypothetical protein
MLLFNASFALDGNNLSNGSKVLTRFRFCFSELGGVAAMGSSTGKHRKLSIFLERFEKVVF